MIVKMGIFCLLWSIGVFLSSLVWYKKFGVMRDDEKERYRAIANKSKEERTKEEQNFYFENQETYYNLKVASICFKLALVLLPLSILLKNIAK